LALGIEVADERKAFGAIFEMTEMEHLVTIG